ncbi:hypothetical protein YYE_02211 [Plasmodium vinckei vinckei]|nr:hypothetical protein YYE_02211 [Plasmodium vinckei vinckei]
MKKLFLYIFPFFFVIFSEYITCLRENSIAHNSQLENYSSGIKNIGNNVCTCDFTDKLNTIPQSKTKIICSLKPGFGDEIRILANKEYDIYCFNNSKIYCPLKNTFISNADINNYSKNLKYTISDIQHNNKAVKEYRLVIDKNATDILFYCTIKPKQISELLEGEVKVDLKREIIEEYAVVQNADTHVCDFSQGNLNISPSGGFFYKNSRSVNCIYKVVPNELFLIKLPKLDVVNEVLLPSIVNCLSEHSFISFTLKNIEEYDDNTTLHLTLGKVNKKFSLVCSFDLLEYKSEPCHIGRKGNVVFYFNP